MTLKDSTKESVDTGVAPAAPCNEKPPARVTIVTPVHPALVGKKKWVKPEYRSINCGSEVTGYFYQG